MKQHFLVFFVLILCTVVALGIWPSHAKAQDPIWLENPSFTPESGFEDEEVFVFTVNYFNTAVTCPIKKFDTPTENTGDGWRVKLAVDSGFDIHIVFMRAADNPPRWEVYYQELDQTGQPLPSMPVPIQISDDDTHNSMCPNIALDRFDDAHIVWIDFRDTNSEIYYAKIANETGNKITPTDIIISDLDGHDSGRAIIPFGTEPEFNESPGIAYAAVLDGCCYWDIVHIVWSDARDAAASDWEVYYQYQDALTFSVYHGDDPISDVDDFDSRSPAIATGLGIEGDENQVHIVWEDARDGAWEIYYEHGPIDPYGPFGHVDSRISGGADGFNSMLPDIDCEKGDIIEHNFIHVAWMDDRDEDPDLDPLYHIPGNWEIYTTILKFSDDDDPKVSCDDCGPKRQSDIYGGGWYGDEYGPLAIIDRHSKYPQIVVGNNHWGHNTHIVWQDGLGLPDYAKVLYSSVPNGCNNPATDVRVTDYPYENTVEVYPSIAMDPDGGIDIKMTVNGTIENAHKTKSKYIELALTTASGSVISTFDMYPAPYDTNAADGLEYHVGLPLRNYNHFFMIHARDSLGNYTSTDVLPGPAVYLVAHLASFAATGYSNHIDVNWTTASEIDNAGFNVHRSLNKEGPYAQINDELIPAKGDELQGASYSFVDRDVTNGLTYHYQLESVDLTGKGIMYGHMSTTAGAGKSPIPDAFGLEQNYPNPFNPITEIKYDLPENCRVRLEVYNVLGQRVTSLVDEYQTAGSKFVNWDASSESSSGIYFYRLQAGSFVQTKKMVLLK